MRGRYAVGQTAYGTTRDGPQVCPPGCNPQPQACPVGCGHGGAQAGFDPTVYGHYWG